MRLDEYSQYDATDLAALVRTGQVRPTELADLAAQAAAAVNPEINAIIELYDDPSQGTPHGPLYDVPTLWKDLTPEAGRLYELGSRLTEGHRATTTGARVERVLTAGATIIGRSATPEMASSSGPADRPIDSTTHNACGLGDRGQLSAAPICRRPAAHL